MITPQAGGVVGVRMRPGGTAGEVPRNHGQKGAQERPGPAGCSEGPRRPTPASHPARARRFPGRAAGARAGGKSLPAGHAALAGRSPGPLATAGFIHLDPQAPQADTGTEARPVEPSPLWARVRFLPSLLPALPALGPPPWPSHPTPATRGPQSSVRSPGRDARVPAVPGSRRGVGQLVSTVALAPTSSASLTKWGLSSPSVLRPAWKGPPPSVAGVKGQRAEGKADSVSMGWGRWPWTLVDCASEGTSRGRGEGRRVMAHGDREGEARSGTRHRRWPTGSAAGGSADVRPRGRGWRGRRGPHPREEGRVTWEEGRGVPGPTHSRKWKGSTQREEVACLMGQPAKLVTAPTQRPRETEAEGTGGLEGRA